MLVEKNTICITFFSKIISNFFVLLQGEQIFLEFFITWKRYTIIIREKNWTIPFQISGKRIQIYGVIQIFKIWKKFTNGLERPKVTYIRNVSIVKVRRRKKNYCKIKVSEKKSLCFSKNMIKDKLFYHTI